MTWTSTHLYLFACVYIDYKITLPNDTLVDSSLTKIKVRTSSVIYGLDQHITLH